MPMISALSAVNLAASSRNRENSRSQPPVNALTKNATTTKSRRASDSPSRNGLPW